MKIKLRIFYVISFLTLILLFPFSSIGQISYLGETFQFQGGTYGLVGSTGICFSPDKKNIYVAAEYTLSVFSYDTATGETVFLKAYKEGDNGIEGLYGGTNVEVSPDGKFVYATSHIYSTTLALFERSAQTGLLTFKKPFTKPFGLHSMAFTKNLKYIYFTSENDDHILACSRDSITGDISLIQSIREHDAGGLLRPLSMRLSNDNRFLYVSSSAFEDAFSIFKIDETTGKLIFVQKVDYITGLHYPQAIDISHDDAYLYLLCNKNLMIFSRNKQDGKVTFIKALSNQDMAGSYSLTVSPDDKNIYTISAYDTSIFTFSRNLATNEFKFVKAHPFLSTSPYTNPSCKAMICDNHFVFSSVYWNSTVYKAKRDTATGLLTLDEKLHFGQNSNVDGLYNARYSCSSSNFAFVSSHYNGISMFKRNDTTGSLAFIRGINAENTGTSLLESTSKVMVTLDNKYLYAFARRKEGDYKAALLIFKIDNENNNVVLVDSVTDNQIGLYEYGDLTDMIMSPDKKHVYVSSYTYDKIFQFEYDSINGSLNLLSDYKFSDGDLSGEMRISNSGQYLFVTSSRSYEICMLSRDTLSGLLSLLGSYNINNYTKFDDMDISGDDNLYLINTNHNLLFNYKIDQNQNSLHLIQKLSYDDDKIESLKDIDNIKVRNDGTFVYTSSYKNNSFGLFYRNPVNGLLTFIHDFNEPDNNFEGLDGITSINIANDDRNLYITSDIEESVAYYKIDLYIGPDLTICDGDTALLDAGQGYKTYRWSTGEGTRQIKAYKQGWYTIHTVDPFGFTDSDSLYLTVNPSPYSDLGPDKNTCNENENAITLNANPDTGDSILWNTGSVSESISATNSGKYWVRLTNKYGCTDSDTIQVTFHPTPEISVGPDITIQPDDTITITAEYDDQNSCSWFNSTTGNSITINSGMFTYNTLSVWAEITTPFNCKNKDEMIVTLDSTKILSVSEITIYPNPTEDYIWVKSNHLIAEIDCYDMSGKFLFKKKPNLKSTKLDFKFIAIGTYFLKIKLDNNYSETHKIEQITP